MFCMLILKILKITGSYTLYNLHSNWSPEIRHTTVTPFCSPLWNHWQISFPSILSIITSFIYIIYHHLKNSPIPKLFRNEPVFMKMSCDINCWSYDRKYNQTLIESWSHNGPIKTVITVYCISGLQLLCWWACYYVWYQYT